MTKTEAMSSPWQNPWLRKLGSVFAIVAGGWFWLAFVGMFFTKTYPYLDPIVRWTFWIYLGTFAATIIAVTVVGPGIYVAKELNDALNDSRYPAFERRLIFIWCCGAGVLLSLVLGTATALLLSGILADIKLWFLGLCWAVLLVPWLVLGAAVRRLIRALDNRGGRRSAGYPRGV